MDRHVRWRTEGRRLRLKNWTVEGRRPHASGDQGRGRARVLPLSVRECRRSAHNGVCVPQSCHRMMMRVSRLGPEGSGHPDAAERLVLRQPEARADALTSASVRLSAHGDDGHLPSPWVLASMQRSPTPKRPRAALRQPTGSPRPALLSLPLDGSPVRISQDLRRGDTPPLTPPPPLLSPYERRPLAL